jgi:general secretion pathway protein E
VRRLCTHCSVADELPDEATAELIGRWLQADSQRRASLRRPVGCPHCAGTGFFGRFAIYDLVELTREIAHQISKGASEGELLGMLGQGDESGLLRSGIEHVALGNTTVAEVLRAAEGL